MQRHDKEDHIRQQLLSQTRVTRSILAQEELWRDELNSAIISEDRELTTLRSHRKSLRVEVAEALEEEKSRLERHDEIKAERAKKRREYELELERIHQEQRFF